MKFGSPKLTEVLTFALFWGISFYICLEFFSRADSIRVVDVIYTFLFYVPMVFAVSMHSFFLLPGYLAKSRFRMYSLLLLVVYGLSVLLYFITFDVISGWIFEGYYFVSIYSAWEVCGFLTIYLLLSSTLEFGRSWFGALQAKNKIMELESQKTASELKVLRAQIQPHFLFNSLNTIYSEALNKSGKAPELILKLSDILRYVVDKADSDKVNLEKEVEYISHYIELNKERLNEPDKVKFETGGDFSDQEIAPLLLITFVENCFKHADLSGNKAYISIRLKLSENMLTLQCKNSVDSGGIKQDSESGAGIKNARRRLELAYPDEFDLNVNSGNDEYEISLKIFLK